MIDSAVRRRRRALFVFFLISGLSMSSWVTRTPDVRDRLGASTGEMGLVLFGLSVGSMLGILGSGPLVSRFGPRPVIGVGTTLIVLSMLLIGLGATTSSAPAVTAGLFLFGAGAGGSEVAINVDGAEVERLTRRTVLPTLHGFFSLGTVIGAGVGIACTAASVPVPWHLAAVALICAALFAHAYRAVPAGTGGARDVPEHAGGGERGRRPAVWKDRRLLLIGGIVLTMALAEGAANDWLPLLMVDGHGMDPALGSAVYAGFAAAMAIGRFGGGFFIDRFGRAPVVRASALSAALGLAVVVFVDVPLVAGAAVFFWGLGASLGFPLALSAAGDSGPDSTARVSLVATIGYVAFLVGPPGLGFLGDHYGLRAAMTAVLVLVAVAILLAPAVGTRPATPAHRLPEQRQAPADAP
ncbi:MFS transporter [Streptomyces caelestis]|uniref:MFS transporter n=1 Tax=Streptomyces heliomycini TaxID=284032 RepID=A0ABV5L747_9ACTN|nr:MFS transporter [Streptomyces sp. XY152]KOV23681.1 membrane protein [Streptomyces sp. XY152]